MLKARKLSTTYHQVSSKIFFIILLRSRIAFINEAIKSWGRCGDLIESFSLFWHFRCCWTDDRETGGTGGRGGVGSMKRLWQGFKPGERKCILTTRALRWQ